MLIRERIYYRTESGAIQVCYVYREVRVGIVRTVVDKLLNAMRSGKRG